MLKTPFHTSEPLISKVWALLGFGNDVDFGPLPSDRITYLTSSLKSEFFSIKHGFYPILIRAFPYCLQIIIIYTT